VSDLVTCPTCQSTLRLPPTAATVRCPKCKTLLQVIDEGAPVAPAAPPLPFAGAAPARPKPASPTNKPHTADRKKHRPQLVDEVAEAELASEEEARKQAAHRREVRRQLEELDIEEEEEAERYEEIEEQCKWGRLALMWMHYGMGGYAVGALCVFFAMLGFVVFTLLGTPFGAVMGPVALLGLALGGLAMLVMTVAFGLALKGPKMPRHIAVFGLVVTGGQIIAVAATLGTAIAKVTNMDADTGATGGFRSMDLAYYVLGLCTNLFLLADTPTRVALAYPFPVLGVVAGIFEFARLVFVCQLTQTYGELAKNDKVAAESGKGISKVFWVLLLTCMFRLAISLIFDTQPEKSGGWLTGQVLHGVLFIVAFGFFGFRLLMLVTAIRETAELVIAERVASKHERLDVV
jgi:LSD1 subclass zinc finger protein